MRTGSLYVIGVGPGDPELLTIKAMNRLREVPVICVPKGREEGTSLALSIASKIIDTAGKEILEAHFPMKKTAGRKEEQRAKKAEHRYIEKTGSDVEGEDELRAQWNRTIAMLISRLKNGQDVAFITLGDPTIYSTFYYLYDRLVHDMPELNIQIIPGISSVNAAAAAAQVSLSLADEKIAILPATYEPDIRSTLEAFDTVVLMKVHKVFDQVRRLLEDMHLMEHAVYICRAGMEDSRIFCDIREVKAEDLNYFSILIIKK